MITKGYLFLLISIATLFVAYFLASLIEIELITNFSFSVVLIPIPALIISFIALLYSINERKMLPVILNTLLFIMLLIWTALLLLVAIADWTAR